MPHHGQVPSSNGQLIKLVNARQGADGSFSFVPGMIGGSKAPSSPVILDLLGGSIRSLVFDMKGSATIEAWRSINQPDPVNQDAIDAARTDGLPEDDWPAPDFSNVEWILESTWTMENKGLHAFPLSLLSKLSASRYIKFTKRWGAVITMVHGQGGASLV